MHIAFSSLLRGRVGAIALALLLVLTSFGTAFARPNIVFVMFDDLAEYEPRNLPTLMALANQGVTFSNTFVGIPLCAPARAMYYSGRFGNHTGVIRNNYRGFGESGTDQRSLFAHLSAGGYRTGLIGKYLNGGPRLNPPGLDQYTLFTAGQGGTLYYNYWLRTNGGDRVYYGSNPGDYSADVLRNLANKFIETAANSAINGGPPFFVVVPISAPHAPVVPAPRHANADCANLYHPTGTRFADYCARYRTLRAGEDLISSLVETLKAKGVYDNTIIVIAGDHGNLLGEHGLFAAKGRVYDESVGTYFTIMGPGIPQGVVRTELVSIADLLPTLLALVGLPIPSDIDGRSLTPLFAENGTALAPADWRKSLAIALPDNSSSKNTLPWFGVRTTRYTFAEYTDGRRWLFDNVADPGQLKNIASTDGGTVARLRSLALAYTTCPLAGCRYLETLD